MTTNHGARRTPLLDALIESGVARKAADGSCIEGLAGDGVWVQIGNAPGDTERFLDSNPTPDTW